ncbi:MAG: CHAP domain-containing protein [Actinobacteria bacterium]|nr:CHAP domain-containing protein [Actinomycetota bacterium]
MSARSGGRLLPLALLAVPATVAAVVVAAVAGLVGATAPCLVGGGSASASGPRVTGAAKQFPPARLHIFMGAARRFDISWPFLASIGVQECGYDGHCGVAPSGCAGVMEIAYVRGSECSPDPSVPTIWETYKVDADGGGASIFDPADAIFTAARILRKTMGAPPTGGSYAAYHEAACNYYGACADGVADYADEVMGRAVEFGFGHEGAAPPAGRAEAAAPVALKTRSNRHHRKISQAAGPQGPACGEAAPRSSTTGGASGEEIVRIARSQLGEAESPLGSNCTKYGPCVEWCALFVSWVWQHAGVQMAGGTTPYAYSGSFYGWVKEHGGRDLPPTATPSPGDAVMFGTAAHMDHVAIVESVFAGTIVTIDGNFGDRVSRVGPFYPGKAHAEGEPAEIYAYAEPPGFLPSLMGVGGD